MEKVIIYREKHTPSDPRLKRIVHHDSRSKLYPFNTSGLTIQSVTHDRHIPILDQGELGSCTGNAGVGALATDPFYKTLPTTSKYPLNQSGAISLYSDAEVIDGTGPYPPNDEGSCGLSIAKALKNAGLISSYQHTFTVTDALKALTVTPILVGVPWYSGMMKTDPDGRLRIRGAFAGGHEIVARQIDAPNQRVWFDNSWGSTWGVNGRFYLTFTDFATLLSQKGDVTILVPNTVSSQSTTLPNVAPTNPDAKLAAAMKEWIAAKGL